MNRRIKNPARPRIPDSGIVKLRPLTLEEKSSMQKYGYTWFESYGPEERPIEGQYWTEDKIAWGRIEGVTFIFDTEYFSTEFESERLKEKFTVFDILDD